MEAAALGASASVLAALIKALVPWLSSVRDNCNKKYEAFQDDANYLSWELPMIATAIEGQLSGQDDHILRLSVKELRQIAHDMEDCIDHITYLASWKQLPWYRIGIIKPVTKKKSLKELGKQMGRLRNQVQQAHQRGERYYVSRPVPTQLPSPSPVYDLRPEDLVGLQVPLKELKQQLSKQEELKQLKVIVIVGFCGSGKSVLAYQLYSSEVGTKYDSNEGEKSKIQAWVSAEHKDSGKILEEIQQTLQIPTRPELTMDQKDHLNNNRYFVVIDGMQSTEQWDAIARFRQDVNTTIVVTTKIQGVAKLCRAANYYVYNMGKLSDDHPKKLLLKAAGLKNDSNSSLSAILKICDGQPLALSTVGKFMQIRSSMKGPYWEGICNQLRCHLGNHPSLKRVHEVLMHEYTSLPSCAVKVCLLYFAMFPSDHRVKPQRIMRQWLAEGFVEPENSLDDTADKCFEELLDRSIVHPIEVSDNETVKTCRTYGMMHEYVMLKSLSENLIMLYDNGNYPKSKNNGKFQHRRLSLQDSSTSDSSSLDSDLSLVRTLIVFGKAGPVLNFDRYQLLRVLDLEECTDFKDHHVKKVCNLLLLKYLSLGGKKDDVTRLPKEIENLKLLETLDLRKTEINDLPKEVFQLPNLTHLFGKFKLPGKAMPSKDCKLQIVKGFLVDECVGYDTFFDRMKKLQNVKIVCKSSATKSSLISVQKAIQAFIRDTKEAGKKDPDPSKKVKEDPRSLSIQVDACFKDFFKDLDGHQCYLRSLKLKGKLEELPGFVTRLRDLEELCLKSTKLTASLLTELGTIESLTYLRLKADELDDFVLQRNALPSLVCIVFDLRSPKLPTMEDGAMPKLKSLQLLCDGLNGLSVSALQINNFTDLREVILRARDGLNRDTIENWQDAAAKHPNRPQVILLQAPDPTEGASIQGSAESWADKNGAESHIPNGLMTESSIASNIMVES